MESKLKHDDKNEEKGKKEAYRTRKNETRLVHDGNTKVDRLETSANVNRTNNASKEPGWTE